MRIAAITWSALICATAGVCSSMLALRHGLYDQLVSSVLRRAGQMEAWTLPRNLEAACYPTRATTLFLDCVVSSSLFLETFYLALTASLIIGLLGCVAFARRVGLSGAGLCVVPCVYVTLGLNSSLGVAEYCLLPWLMFFVLTPRPGIVVYLALTVLWALSSVHWYVPGVICLAVLCAGFQADLSKRVALLAVVALAAGVLVQLLLFPVVFPFVASGLNDRASGFIMNYYGLSSPDYHANAALPALLAATIAAVLWRPEVLARSVLGVTAVSMVLCSFFALFQPLVALWVGVVLGSFFEDPEVRGSVSTWFPPLMIVIGMLVGWDQGVKYVEGPDGSMLRTTIGKRLQTSSPRAFNDISLRSNLAARDTAVFVDERLALFAGSRPQSFLGSPLEDYLEVAGGGAKFKDVIEAWDINAAAVKHDSTIFTLLTERLSWRELAVWGSNGGASMLEAPSGGTKESATGP